MKQFYVYFMDNLNTDPHPGVERMVVEAENQYDAVKKFKEETDFTCTVRSVDEVK